MADELQIKIVLDDGSVKTGFINLEKQAKDTAGKVGTNLGGSFDAISSKIKGLAATLAAAFTTVKLVNFLKDSANAASEAETATNALAASLANIGKFSQGAVNSFEQFASNLQKTTGVQDDLIKQNAALLVSIGNLSGDGLERGTTAALNLAQALQIDVGTAFDLVAKAASGNTTQLGRYGIKLDENIPKSEKFAKTLELIEKRFGGLAETKLNTFDGALINLSNSFGEIQESVGKFITQSPALRSVINQVAGDFFGLSESIDSVRGKNEDPFKPILMGVLNLAKVINEYLIKPLELGFNLIRTGVLSIYSVVQGLIALFVNAGNAINLYLFKPIIEGFGFIGEKLVGLFSPEMGEKLRANVQAFADMVGGSLGTAAASTASVFEDSFNSLAQSADDTFKSKIGGSIDAYISKLKEAASVSEMTSKQIVNGSAASAQAIVEYSASVKSAAAGMKAGIATSLSSIGAALVNGEGLFDNFGKGIIGIMGDLAINIGTTLLFTGNAIEAFISSINTLFPGSGFAAAAAGVGLILFGGALKAAAGKGSGGAAPSSTGGGIATTPSSTTELTPQESLTRQEPSTAVQVTIQGDVLDSDESGSRIVALINEAFDKKGVVVNQGMFA